MHMGEPDVRRIGEAYDDALGGDRVRRGVRLDTRTTFRTGGTADWFLETRSGREIVRALQVSRGLGLPVTLLGGGSNVLVGERGVRGLVIRIWRGGVVSPRPGVVRADGGVTLNSLVRWMVNRGLAGLERWAGTPGTVGGGLHGNAHFQGELLGGHLLRASLADPRGRVCEVDAATLDLGYDTSRMQRSGEAVLWAEFAATDGAPAALRKAACASLAYRKQTQPLAVPSAGCIFQNPDAARDAVPDGIPASAGALIDRAGLKGLAVGDALVSRLHGNFIVTGGRATASDIRRLIEECRETVYRRLGVMLRNEIVCLGEFDWQGAPAARPSGAAKVCG